MTDAKEQVKKQYGSVGDAYVISTGHARGNDLDRMLELANLTGDERLLDIATGGGHVAHKFSPHVREVIASDLTLEILKHASDAFEKWGLVNVSVTEADAENMPFDDTSFDIVTCRIAPHHFPNPDLFVREAARVLKQNGKFLLVDSTVPEGENGEVFNHFEEVRDPSHVRSLTIGEWTELICDAGLSLQHTESFRKRHDFADWVGRSRTSESDIATLQELMRTANESLIWEFDVEFDGSGITSFVDTKTLFIATKSGDTP